LYASQNIVYFVKIEENLIIILLSWSKTKFGYIKLLRLMIYDEHQRKPLLSLCIHVVIFCIHTYFDLAFCDEVAYFLYSPMRSGIGGTVFREDLKYSFTSTIRFQNLMKYCKTSIILYLRTFIKNTSKLFHFKNPQIV